jgi:transposase
LTPKDHSTAGKTRLGIITRAGDEALRSTLVVGATALLRQDRVSEILQDMLGAGLLCPASIAAWSTKKAAELAPFGLLWMVRF